MRKLAHSQVHALSQGPAPGKGGCFQKPKHLTTTWTACGPQFLNTDVIKHIQRKETRLVRGKTSDQPERGEKALGRGTQNQAVTMTTRKVKVLAAQSCPTVHDYIDYSPPRSSVHGVFQARILEWVAMPFSRTMTTLGP